MYTKRCQRPYQLAIHYRAHHAYEQLIEPLRLVARQHGYAIAQHGSLSRDIDLIAAPWTEDAVNPEQLLTALLAIIERYNHGIAYRIPYNPSIRPHYRYAYSIHLGNGVYIDLSIFAPRSFAAQPISNSNY